MLPLKVCVGIRWRHPCLQQKRDQEAREEWQHDDRGGSQGGQEEKSLKCMHLKILKMFQNPILRCHL